jgi:hypothetical protein
VAERGSWAVQQVGGVGVQTVEDARYSMGALWTPAGAITSRSGMVPTGAAAVPGSVLATLPTANTFVHVQPFRFVRQSSRGGGTYTMILDSIKDIDILNPVNGGTAADPTNSRIDLIIAQQSDAYFGDANSNMVVKRVGGTPSGSPSDPPVPGSPDYVLLARVTVPPNATTIQTSNIANVALPSAVAVGGLLPVADATERNAISTPYDGMQIYRRDMDWIETYDGGAWRAPAWCRTTALANITNPFSGQVALLTTDNFAYRWTGTQWSPMFPGAAAPWGRIGEVKKTTADNISALAVMESVTVSVVAGRRYQIDWNANHAANTTGPPNGTIAIRTAAGGSITTSSTVIRTAGLLINNATFQPVSLSTTYVATATETRTFGITATSNGSPVITFEGGADRRLLAVTDVGV